MFVTLRRSAAVVCFVGFFFFLKEKEELSENQEKQTSLGIFQTSLPEAGSFEVTFLYKVEQCTSASRLEAPGIPTAFLARSIQPNKNQAKFLQAAVLVLSEPTK